MHLAAAVTMLAASPSPAAEAAGAALASRANAVRDAYRTACAPCHGIGGRGDGPTAFSIAPGQAPRPRDFTTGLYKLRSTPSGRVPTRDDLVRTIRRGIPRYMPAFTQPDDTVVDGLVTYIMGFSPRFAGEPPTPLALPDPPAVSDGAAVGRGADLYRDLGCAVCHGEKGRGDGTAAAALRDSSGLRIWPADLAHPSWFKGGHSARDVYRTLVTGLDGTPMAGYGDAFADLDPGAPWDLIAYIESLSRE
jgi:mono/diheme cytochrome c family protein